MADAFMKGYGFVDNIQRQHRADDRLTTLQGREDTAYQQSQEDRQVRMADSDVARTRNDTIYNQAQEDRAKKLAEDKAYAKYSGEFFELMDQEQRELYEKAISALPPEAKGEKAKAVVADAIMNPDKIDRAIKTWDTDIVGAFNSGKLPDKKKSLDVLNTVLHPELQARFSKNGLRGKLSDIVPSRDGKGLYFEAAVADAYGRQYSAPLTDGAGSVNDPDSAKHQVQNMPVGKTMEHTGNAVETYRSIMGVLAKLNKEGGSKGQELSWKIAQDMGKGKRDRAKAASDRAWEKEKINLQTEADIRKEQAKGKTGQEQDQQFFQDDPEGHAAYWAAKKAVEAKGVTVPAKVSEAMWERATAEAEERFPAPKKEKKSFFATEEEDAAHERKMIEWAEGKNDYAARRYASLAGGKSGQNGAPSPDAVPTEEIVKPKNLNALMDERYGAEGNSIPEPEAEPEPPLGGDQPVIQDIPDSNKRSASPIINAIQDVPKFLKAVPGKTIIPLAKEFAKGLNNLELDKAIVAGDIAKIKAILNKYPDAVRKFVQSNWS
jgi:hypothetical protein